jgi:hypothetical protein
MHYPHNDTHSYIKPYDQREHAWTNDQMKNSHLKEFETETKTPTHYTKPYNPASALHQMRSRTNPHRTGAETEEDEEAIADKLEKDPEYSTSKSKMEPYAVRDYSWNFR